MMIYHCSNTHECHFLTAGEFHLLDMYFTMYLFSFHLENVLTCGIYLGKLWNLVICYEQEICYYMGNILFHTVEFWSCYDGDGEIENNMRVI
jgi:hypothetical protein